MLDSHVVGQCGNVVKVTPSSKVVGDFAQWMTQNNLTATDVIERAESLDFPSSVVEFFQGYLGQPVGGFPEPLRSRIIRDKPRIDGRPGVTMEPLDFKKIKAELRAKFGKHITDADVSSYVMYPKVFEEYQGFIEKYGDLSVIPTRYFLGRPDVGEEMHISIEKGKTLIIRLMAVGPVVEGRAQRDVWFEVNGEVRAVSVEDKNSAVETVSRERATNDPGSVGAPMSGVVVEVRVKEGQEIKKGDPVAVLSAMKVSLPVFECLSFDDEHEIDGVLCHCSCFWTRQARHCPRGRLSHSGRPCCGDCALDVVSWCRWSAFVTMPIGAGLGMYASSELLSSLSALSFACSLLGCYTLFLLSIFSASFARDLVLFHSSLLLGFVLVIFVRLRPLHLECHCTYRNYKRKKKNSLCSILFCANIEITIAKR